MTDDDKALCEQLRDATLWAKGACQKLRDEAAARIEALSAKQDVLESQLQGLHIHTQVLAEDLNAARARAGKLAEAMANRLCSRGGNMTVGECVAEGASVCADCEALAAAREAGVSP